MTYRTKQGDTWDLIAYRVYGSSRYTPQIIDANREYVTIMIFNAGIELTIPDITTEKGNFKLPPWRV